jgi:large subunit ribosomal protein L20
MVRVTNGLQRHKRHKKFRGLAKGFRLWRSSVYKQIRLALVKQGQHAYVGRKEKKREQRQIWIERLSSALRMKGLKYSTFIAQTKEKNVILNRKVLSNIAIAFPNVFDSFVTQITK